MTTEDQKGAGLNGALAELSPQSERPEKVDGGHDWKRDEYGSVDIFAHEVGHHNGPQCERCGESFCHYCNRECYTERCPDA